MITYEPEIFRGGDQEELIAWIMHELMKVRAVTGLKLDQQVEYRSSPPERLKEGLIVGADGTAWNPGSGKGLYIFRDAVWRKMD